MPFPLFNAPLFSDNSENFNVFGRCVDIALLELCRQSIDCGGMKRLLILFVLSACSQTVGLPPVPDGDADSCGAAQYGAVVGQPATALEKVLILGQVQLIRPTTAVTQDFRPERINFFIDSTETITAITCG